MSETCYNKKTIKSKHAKAEFKSNMVLEGKDSQRISANMTWWSVSCSRNLEGVGVRPACIRKVHPVEKNIVKSFK